MNERLHGDGKRQMSNSPSVPFSYVQFLTGPRWENLTTCMTRERHHLHVGGVLLPVGGSGVGSAAVTGSGALLPARGSLSVGTGTLSRQIHRIPVTRINSLILSTTITTIAAPQSSLLAAKFHNTHLIMIIFSTRYSIISN